MRRINRFFCDKLKTIANTVNSRLSTAPLTITVREHSVMLRACWMNCQRWPSTRS